MHSSRLLCASRLLCSSRLLCASRLMHSSRLLWSSRLSSRPLCAFGLRAVCPLRVVGPVRCGEERHEALSPVRPRVGIRVRVRVRGLPREGHTATLRQVPC
jgi:hypothetical protein